MNRTLLVCLVVLAVISCSFGQECGSNEEFTNCGSACEPSCDKPVIRVCTFECKIGCQCKEGYLRNKDGSCVSREDC